MSQTRLCTMRKKYSGILPKQETVPLLSEEEALFKVKPQLSAYDTKILARLIRKYGSETIVAAAKVLPPTRSPGRPSRGQLPYFSDAAPHLSASNTKVLARLIRKYGS